ncbi:hypothetical protein Droror1_Dr00015957 [Drosera rotundifolia]
MVMRRGAAAVVVNVVEIEEDKGVRAPRFAPELRLFVGIGFRSSCVSCLRWSRNDEYGRVRNGSSGVAGGPR